MKKSISKILLGLGAIVCTFNANAQWTTTGTVIRPVTLTNNVSVGTTVNGANLYVEKAQAVTLGIKSTTAGATMFMDKGSSSANAAFAYKLGGVTQWNSGMLGGNNYSIRDVVSNTFPLVVAQFSGNIGLGTNTPSVKLDLFSTTADVRFKSTTGQAYLQIDRGTSTTDGYVNFMTAGVDGWVVGPYASSAFRVIDWPNGGSSNAAFFIAQGGSNNVGIGTVSPITKLDVVGQAHIMVDNSAVDYTSSNARLESSGSSGFFPSLSYSWGGTNNMKLYGSTYLEIADNAGGYTSASASAFNVASDIRMKKDITNISAEDYTSYLKQIKDIQSITYLYNDETAASGEINKNKMRVAPHVGFSAQSLPLAITNEISAIPGQVNGEKRIGFNLSDLAGLTLIGVKALDAKTEQLENANEMLKKQNAEMKARIDLIEHALSQCCTNFTPATDKANASNMAEAAGLQQNQPNPFNQNTIIRFSLTSGSQNANIIIRDLNGGLVKQINVTKANNGQVVINALELKQGTYTYTLEVNGNSIDTKLMVVTK